MVPISLPELPEPSSAPGKNQKRVIQNPIFYMKHIESIEQMRIIESEFSLHSVDVSPSLPSINEPHEVNIVLDYLKSNKEQQILLKKIISND